MNKNIFLLLLLLIPVFSIGTNKIEILKDSLSYFEGHKKAKTLFIIGNYYYPNNNDSALYFVEKALKEYAEINDEKGMVSSYGLLAAIYGGYGMYDTAIALNYKVIKWGEQHNDIRAFIAYLELGNTYEKLKQYTKAKEFYSKAIAGTYLPAKMAAFANMGLLFLNNKDYDSATYFFNGALGEYYKNDTGLYINKYNIATIYLNLASVDYGKGEYEKGIKLLNKSLNIFNEVGNNSSAAKVYLKLGEGYSYLQKNDVSMQYYLKAKSIADSLQITLVQEEVYLVFTEHYRDKGDYKKAFFNLEEYHKLHDSLVVLGYKSTIAEIEVKYAVQDKINKIDVLNKEKRDLFRISIIIVTGILLISAFIILLFNHRRLRLRSAKSLSDAESRLARAKTKTAEHELKRIVASLHEKSAFIEELEDEIKKLSINEEQEHMEEKVQALRKTRILTDNDWEEYNRAFNEIYPLFCDKTRNYNELSTGDKRQIIFLKLGLRQKEIAYLMGISPKGVKKAQQRLSKRIGLIDAGGLKEYVESL
jgi:tetratricopeptide (TPR) repeat protein